MGRSLTVSTGSAPDSAELTALTNRVADLEAGVPGYRDRTGSAVTFGATDLGDTHAIDATPTLGTVSASLAGQYLTLRNAGGSALTVAAATDVTIDGELVIDPGRALSATPDGTDSWWVVGGRE